MSVWHGGNRRRPRRRSAQPSAPIDQRRAVYQALTGELGLSEQHREHLAEVRGIPPRLHGLFATMPTLPVADRIGVVRRVGERIPYPVLGVAGVYKHGRAGTPALAPFTRDDTGFTPTSALVIPVPDHLGRIQAMQLRADDAPAGARRYVMLSSSWLPGGAKSGTPVAVWRPHLKQDGSWLVEGPMKGLIAAERLGACVLATCGVALWRPALEVLNSAPRGYPVTIAYDAPDLVTVPEVWQAREALATALHARGCAVRVASWEGAKGIDDALLAGLPVRVEPWAPTLAPTVPRRTIALPTPTRPASIPLMVVTR